ncbi:DUF559 domain-containing protein [Microbacterium sp. NPDC056057]|uniref:DUF559 domain-containing protein n=1 Tax=Microbacterium sp. NPDC056057 TaxID=3345699 RepID=UPI0035D69F9E
MRDIRHGGTVDQQPSEQGFLVHDARKSGRSRRWIDGGQFDRPFHGVRAPRVDDADAHADDFELARQQILRSASHWSLHMHRTEYFSHLTAAIIWGLPLPAWGALSRELHVSSPGRATRVQGATGHQVRPSLVTIVTDPKHGLRVTDPATTWAMLAVMLRHPYDVVAVGDAIVRTPRIPGPSGRVEHPPLGSIAGLAAAMMAGRRVGVRTLRDALPLVRPGAASRPETWARLTLVDAGLPEPLLDFDVYDDRGTFVGCVDLVYLEWKIAIEYEGDQHRTDPVQWQRDIEKHEKLADIGWRVVRVPRNQLFLEPGVFIGRVRALLRSRG